jgi:hypothetical protein
LLSKEGNRAVKGDVVLVEESITGEQPGRFLPEEGESYTNRLRTAGVPVI